MFGLGWEPLIIYKDEKGIKHEIDGWDAVPKGCSRCRKHLLAFASHLEWWEHIVGHSAERDRWDRTQTVA
jgi:hypothetical protein